MNNNEAILLARKSHLEGNLEHAEHVYREILKTHPKSAGAYYELGNVLQDKELFDEAIYCYQKSIEFDPAFSGSYNNLGNVFRKKEQIGNAIVCFQRAIKLAPNFFGSYYNLGEVLQEQGQLDEAITCYQKALQLNPNHVATINNLGNALRDKGQIEMAITLYQRAIALNPDLPEAHSNLSLALLLLGDLKQGWKEYEWRLKKDYNLSRCSQPTGEDLCPKGKSFFICAEQGIGDEIMFASCLPDVIEQANKCTVECDKRLVPLFSRSFPEVMFVEHNKENTNSSAIVEADIRIPIGSLPKSFRPGLTSFPRQTFFLIPDLEKVEGWRNRLKALGSVLKVGISWRGGAKPEVMRIRSVIPDQLAGILSVPEACFINLQYGDCSGELRETQEKLSITIHDWEDINPLKDLDNFAAQIAALDLVISVDNSTVHMAGALGIPVWVLLPFVPNWRWMLSREDSPWYPTMRLFRQPSPGDWESVMAKVKDELVKLSGNY